MATSISFFSFIKLRSKTNKIHNTMLWRTTQGKHGSTSIGRKHKRSLGPDILLGNMKLEIENRLGIRCCPPLFCGGEHLRYLCTLNASVKSDQHVTSLSCTTDPSPLYIALVTKSSRQVASLFDMQALRNLRASCCRNVTEMILHVFAFP